MLDASRLRRFDNLDGLIDQLAGDVVERLTEGVRLRGAASLVVPGGTTPGRLFDALCGKPAPWDRVQVTVTDERWLPTGHPDSNERLVRSRLLKGRAAQATFIPLKTEAPTPEAAEPAVEAAVSRMPRPFDFTLLGMGADGHVASLFPHALGLRQALDPQSPLLACSVHVPQAAGSAERMSLTLRALLESRFIALLITGADKLATFERALEDGYEMEMPVRAILRQARAPVQVYWAA